MENMKMKKKYSLETLIFIIIFFAFFGGLSSVMGLPNMMNTLMKIIHID